MLGRATSSRSDAPTQARVLVALPDAVALISTTYVVSCPRAVNTLPPCEGIGTPTAMVGRRGTETTNGGTENACSNAQAGNAGASNDAEAIAVRIRMRRHSAAAQAIASVRQDLPGDASLRTKAHGERQRSHPRYCKGVEQGMYHAGPKNRR